MQGHRPGLRAASFFRAARCREQQCAGDQERGGGGTDAAYAALSGKPVIESLGLPGYGYHSNQAEYVMIDAIPRRLYLASRLVMELGSGR